MHSRKQEDENHELLIAGSRKLYALSNPSTETEFRSLEPSKLEPRSHGKAKQTETPKPQALNSKPKTHKSKTASSKT